MEGIPEWKELPATIARNECQTRRPLLWVKEIRKVSGWILIDSNSDEAKSSTRRITLQVSEEALRTKCSVTTATNLEQGSGDLEEEFSHASRNNVASPPSYNGAATRTVTRRALQAVGRPGHVAGSIGVQFLKDDMSYPYPKYSNHPNARSHVKQFQSIWTVNHEIQGLSAANAEQSKIVEVQLSLEG